MGIPQRDPGTPRDGGFRQAPGREQDVGDLDNQPGPDDIQTRRAEDPATAEFLPQIHTPMSVPALLLQMLVDQRWGRGAGRVAGAAVWGQ